MRYLTTMAILFGLTLPAQQPEMVPLHWKRLLAQQGFSGALEGKVNLVRVGTLPCGAQRLRIFFYSWEESDRPGEAIHANYRVVFLENENKYVGSYVVADRPSKVTGNELRFDYPAKFGNAISCDHQALPSKVLLDGEIKELGK